MGEARHGKILLVEDEAGSREAMAEWLQRRGFEVVAVGVGEAALEYLHEGVAVVVTDLKMPRVDGMELLRRARREAPHAAVIVVTGYGDVDDAVAAIKEGAFDFLTKPISAKELTHRIEQAMEKQAMASEIAQLHARLSEKHGFENLVGAGPAMRRLFEKIRLVADTGATVLVVGESGTGKELVARAIHHNSSRRARPFVPVNCAAIPEGLVESELFGHEKGAFTGASQRRRGLFQAADGGTLFIDEIGELPPSLQSKLLRALESRRVMPVGSVQEVEVDVRIVAATNRDLAEAVRRKEFREDLYYRLKVVELRLPPLRERREDIPLLARHFLDQLPREHGRPTREIAPDALQALTRYDWPGNVRELRNMLEGIVVLSTQPTIELDDLPEAVRGARSAGEIVEPQMTMEQIEREAIRRTLERTGGSRTEAARILDISVRTLQRKIKQFELPF